MSMLPSHVVLTLLCGDSRQLTRTLRWGAVAAPFSVGSRGDWVVRAEGVLDVHLYLSFQGSRLRCAAATDHAAVSAHGTPLRTTWTDLSLPLEICFGSARLGVHALVGSAALSREPVPDLSRAQHRRPAPQDLTQSDVLVTQIIDLSGICLEARPERPVRAALVAPTECVVQALRAMPLAQTQCDGGALRALAARLAADSARMTPTSPRLAPGAGLRAGRAWLAQRVAPWWAGVKSASTRWLPGPAASGSLGLDAARSALAVLRRATARRLAELRETSPRERLIALTLPVAAAGLSWSIVASGVAGSPAPEPSAASPQVELAMLEAPPALPVALAPVALAPVAPIAAAPIAAAQEPAAAPEPAAEPGVAAAPEPAAALATVRQPVPEAPSSELEPPPARPDLERDAFRAAFNGADAEAAALYRQLAARRDAPLFELASGLAGQGRVRKP